MLRSNLFCASFAVALLLIASALAAGPAAAQSATTIVAGELRVDATMDHIGAVWFIEGDVDLDSSMTLEFRLLGDSSWRMGAPAMRADPTVTVDGSPLNINSWASSALFLERGRTYELRVTLRDPDGGGTSRVVRATTRTMPQPGPAIRHVAPGAGGGSGTSNDPFRGVQAAADNANPGDTFRLAAGTYKPFQLIRSGTANAPISFVGPENGTAVIDGRGTLRGVVTIGQFGAPIEHVIVSGLTIRSGRWGVDAQRTSHLTVTDNTIEDVDFGVYNRRDNADEGFQIVCDNRVSGRTPWPGSGIPGERGIDLRGWGNTVCHNEVSDFGDCVSVQPIIGPSFGNDVFGNDAYRCVDDGIEVDYNQANVRVYRNRVTNARMGVSVQPIYGGPAYIFRNELFNLESNTIKLNNAPSGLFIAHNSGVKVGNALNDGSIFTNTVLRNNLFLGTRYAFEITTSSSQGFRDFDYDAWGTTRTSEPWFKWENIRHSRVGDLPAGVEDHGTEIGFDSVRSASLPASFDIEVTVGSPDLRLVASSAAVDLGAEIANLNEPFVSDGQPDAGAFELGTGRQSYGPGTPLIPPPSGPEPERFACQSDAGVLTWTDDDQSKYWAYRKAPGSDTFVWMGRTLGATTIDDRYPAPGTQYQVHYQGIPRSTCTIISEPDAPVVDPGPFSCEATAGVLTWSDHEQSKYWAYRKAPGSGTFVWMGRTLGATTIDDRYPAPGTQYQVHYQGIPRSTCTVIAEPS